MRIDYCQNEGCGMQYFHCDCGLKGKQFKSKTDMKTGIELIAIERQEQIEKHGYSLKNDNEYNKNGELSQVARYLISPISVEQEWPRNWSRSFKDDIDRKSFIHKLKVAGALIAAEIDRLQNQ